MKVSDMILIITIGMFKIILTNAAGATHEEELDGTTGQPSGNELVIPAMTDCPWRG